MNEKERAGVCCYFFVVLFFLLRNDLFGLSHPLVSCGTSKIVLLGV